MSDLPSGSNGGSGHPASPSQPADRGHGHFMNTRSPKFARITADQLRLVKPEGESCHIGHHAIPPADRGHPPSHAQPLGGGIPTPRSLPVHRLTPFILPANFATPI